MQEFRNGQQLGVTSPPVLASAIASVITGTALVATRFVVSGSDGLTIATVRYVIAAICLLSLVPFFDRITVTLRDLFPIAGLGIIYFCFFPWCISSAMKFTTASSGAIVLACTPGATLLLGHITGRERWSIRKGFGVVFAVLGVAIAIRKVGFSFEATEWRGDVLMILATLLGAIYAIFSKPYLKKYSPLVLTATAMGAGALALLCLWTAIDHSQGNTAVGFERMAFNPLYRPCRRRAVVLSLFFGTRSSGANRHHDNITTQPNCRRHRGSALPQRATEP